MDIEEADKNALQRSVSEMWLHDARHMRSGLLHNTGNPGFPQVMGRDRSSHLTYEDEERGLRFIWNGNPNRPVEVWYLFDELPHQRLGEMNCILWEFFYADHKADVVISGAQALVMEFGVTCRRWIEAKEDAR